MIYNWNIIGHEKQLMQLEKDISSGNVSHAYLLWGPGHIGKYTVAKKLASILQCENNFCGVCSTCLQIRKGSHIDTMEFENNHEALKIEHVREIISRCNMSPQGKYKVVILQSIGRMTTEAANALLKTLEEPPNNTIFIMTTSNIREVLPTILSRSRIVRFHLFPHDFLIQMLKKKYLNIDDEKIDQAARLSLGRAGFAIDLMEQPEKFADYLKLYKDISYLLETDNIVERFSYVENILDDEKRDDGASNIRTDDFLNVMTHVLRTRMIEFASKKGVDVRALIDMIAKVQDASSSLKKNVNARLLLENLMLN
ncbi:MAG TPA: AAA family ATPase [Candidatus Gracilibacteria bacterium]|nr:AAA family ATPase [Candidatus Gracilibacteria bacterium]